MRAPNPEGLTLGAWLLAALGSGAFATIVTKIFDKWRGREDRRAITAGAVKDEAAASLTQAEAWTLTFTSMKTELERALAVATEMRVTSTRLEAELDAALERLSATLADLERERAENARLRLDLDRVRLERDEARQKAEHWEGEFRQAVQRETSAVRREESNTPAPVTEAKFAS